MSNDYMDYTREESVSFPSPRDGENDYNSRDNAIAVSIGRAWVMHAICALGIDIRDAKKNPRIFAPAILNKARTIARPQLHSGTGGDILSIAFNGLKAHVGEELDPLS